MRRLDWLGIGAQRAGTTWFTSLLTQHPRVGLAVADQKELHRLYTRPLRSWGPVATEKLLGLVDAPDELLIGECTPYYLRALWVPAAARDVLSDHAFVFVLLRDPLERFASAIRHETHDWGPGSSPTPREMRAVMSDAQWGGMYLTQLRAWERVLGRERLLVLQYEAVARDPQAALDRTWARLELEPVALEGVDVASDTSTDHAEWTLDRHPELAAALREAYAPQVAGLTGWGINPELWSNFA